MLLNSNKVKWKKDLKNDKKAWSFRINKTTYEYYWICMQTLETV